MLEEDNVGRLYFNYSSLNFVISFYAIINFERLNVNIIV